MGSAVTRENINNYFTLGSIQSLLNNIQMSVRSPLVNYYGKASSMNSPITTSTANPHQKAYSTLFLVTITIKSKYIYQCKRIPSFSVLPGGERMYSSYRKQWQEVIFHWHRYHPQSTEFLCVPTH